MIKVPCGAGRHKRHASRGTVRGNRKKGVEDGLSWEVEAMPADQAEVVSEYMAVKLVAELSA